MCAARVDLILNPSVVYSPSTGWLLKKNQPLKLAIEGNFLFLFISACQVPPSIQMKWMEESTHHDNPGPVAVRIH